MKKTVGMFLVMVIMTIGLFASPVSAAEVEYQEVNVIIDGSLQTFEQPAVIINGSTMVPMRAIFETLGATVSWDQATQSVTASKGATIISISIGKTAATVNNGHFELPVAPQLVNGHTMVPLRFVSESLGGTVEWEGTSKTAIIISKETLDFLTVEYSTNNEVDVDKYFDESIYANIENYTYEETAVNSMLGMDFSGLMQDMIMDYYTEAFNEAFAKQAEEEKRQLDIKTATSIVSSIVGKENLTVAEFQTIWNQYDTLTKEEIMAGLNYEEVEAIWELLSDDDKKHLWYLIDLGIVTKFFDQNFDDQEKMEIWEEIMTPFERRYIWVQLRFIDESRPMHMWNLLSDEQKVDFYYSLDHHQEWLLEQLSEEEYNELAELITPGAYG